MREALLAFCWADKRVHIKLEAFVVVLMSDALSTPSKLPKTRSLNAVAGRRNISKFFLASAAKPHDELVSMTFVSFDRVITVAQLALAAFTSSSTSESSLEETESLDDVLSELYELLEVHDSDELLPPESSSSSSSSSLLVCAKLGVMRHVCLLLFDFAF